MSLRTILRTVNRNSIYITSNILRPVLAEPQTCPLMLSFHDLLHFCSVQFNFTFLCNLQKAMTGIHTITFDRLENKSWSRLFIEWR